MKIEGNEKYNPCPQVLASAVFRYSGIPPLFCGVPAVPLVFCIPLFRIPVVFRCSGVVLSLCGCSVYCLCSSVPVL